MQQTIEVLVNSIASFINATISYGRVLIILNIFELKLLQQHYPRNSGSHAMRQSVYPGYLNILKHDLYHLKQNSKCLFALTLKIQSWNLNCTYFIL